MAKDLLFEIGMEEIPARFVRAAVKQLEQKTAAWLSDSRIAFGETQAFATPRRIAVRVLDVAEKQADLHQEVKGPSRKIALDDRGEWSKAALGFARSQGVEPGELVFRDLSGVEYVYASKNSAGVPTEEIIGAGLQSIVQSMTFPKNMRWGEQDMKFVRPIRWLVALFGAEVIPLEIAGVSAGRISRGHRFLGGDASLDEPRQYEEKLKAQFVYVDMQERQELILRQIRRLGEEKGWHISIKDDLLEEVLFLVEYPTALFGGFDADFLHIPQEVLITSMREHQRYFPVLDREGALLPFFVTVRNGDAVSLEQVSKGNEKVLRARLSDAAFFYREDQKLPLETALSRLESIVFHDELGSVGDKVRRIRAIAGELARLLEVDRDALDDIERAADICKFDLVTQMVYEFPELQGVMGEDYARRAGEKERVARAVNEHYRPRFSGDASPELLVGAVVGLADKIDTIVGCFSLGLIPTGSQDPYALRRQAAGIVQILLDHRLALKLPQLFEAAMRVHEQNGLLKRDKSEMNRDLLDFFALRVKNTLSEQVRYDVVDAVMSSGFEDVQSVVRRGQALMRMLDRPDVKPVVDSFARVNNLAAKAESAKLCPELFVEAVEHELHQAWLDTHELYLEQLASFREEQALETISRWKEPINRYFELVMVMAEDPRLREARLALLGRIAADVRRFADFQKLVW